MIPKNLAKIIDDYAVLQDVELNVELIDQFIGFLVSRHSKPRFKKVEIRKKEITSFLIESIVEIDEAKFLFYNFLERNEFSACYDGKIKNYEKNSQILLTREFNWKKSYLFFNQTNQQIERMLPDEVDKSYQRFFSILRNESERYQPINQRF